VRDPRSPPSSDDGLEELGDEVIIAQESGAHTPQRRVKVTTDHPSVVISEPPLTGGSKPPLRSPRRERTEQTVVIRDRRRLDKMRQHISERQRKPRVEARTVYLLAAAALASLALGTLIAAIVDSSAGASTPSPELRDEATGVVPGGALPRASSGPGALDVDSLPEKPAKPRRADSVSQ
jgi:hypothetical protein